MNQFFIPDWPAPSCVRSVITTQNTNREGLHAESAKLEATYGSNNLALHVGDSPRVVLRNRESLAQRLGVFRWQWLTQVHGVEVLIANEATLKQAPEADAVTTRERGLVCAVLTADCLPVLFCNQQGTQVAAAHAGWRGLAAGVLENTVQQFAEGDELMAYLGPAIGPAAFEVGPEVKATFEKVLLSAPEAFKPSERQGHYYANLYELAKQQLNALGVKEIHGGDFCTYSDDRFYSYRRKKNTGRLASGIWVT